MNFCGLLNHHNAVGVGDVRGDAYEAASVHTGQSLPNSSRSGPNTASAWSTYGRMSSAVHADQSASVTRPGQLGDDVVALRQSRDVVAHGSHGRVAIAASPDDRARTGRRRPRALLRATAGSWCGQNQQLVDQTASGDLAEACEHRRPLQPCRIRLVLHQAADPDQPSAGRASPATCRVVRRHRARRGRPSRRLRRRVGVAAARSSSSSVSATSATVCTTTLAAMPRWLDARCEELVDAEAARRWVPSPRRSSTADHEPRDPTRDGGRRFVSSRAPVAAHAGPSGNRYSAIDASSIRAPAPGPIGAR